MALFNSTNGSVWRYNFNWLVTNTPSDWSGVTVIAGHVIELHLQTNQLSGFIPLELGNLTNLTILELYGNELNGNIPPELGNLTHLTIMYLLVNHLSGSIPAELGNLTSLQILWLQNNHLEGDVPSTFIQLVNLYDAGQYYGHDGLDLDYNALNVPAGYPDPGDPLQVFLFQKDPDWHLRQTIVQYFFLPAVQR